MERLSVRVSPNEKLQGIYWVRLGSERKLATLNLAAGTSIYGEELVVYKKQEYRLWDPFRSKFAAAIMRGLKTAPIKPKHKVLYLGAASGTTASHVSDIVGVEGYVYCIEFAPRAIRDLTENVCKIRSNMAPILADARFPETYRMLVEVADDIYCDIAQPEQARILADNADLFLKEGGEIMLAIKARSIDVTKEPEEIYNREIKTLENRDFKIVQLVRLEPYDKAHVMVVAEYKS